MPRRQMRDPDGAVGLVHVLAAGALGAVGVDLQVALVDLDLGVVGQERRDDHGRERRLAAVGGVERREAHEPVLAALGLEDPVGVLALDREGGALEARLLPRARLEQVDLEAALAAPALVHPQHHLRPVLGVGAAGARLERHDGVAGVVVAVEERCLLEPLELAVERPDRRGDLAGHRRIQLVEVACVLVLAHELARRSRCVLRDARVLGARLLGSGLVVPEPGRVHLGFERGAALSQASRVKGNHGPSRAGP